MLAGFCGPGFPERGLHYRWIPVHYTLEIKCDRLGKLCRRGKDVSFSTYLQKIYIQHTLHPYLSFVSHLCYHPLCVYGCTLGSMCVHTCVLTLPSLACRGTTLRPFAARAPRWLIEHSVMSPPFHWGLSQSAQTRLLSRRPHRHHSPILDESSFGGLKGLFQRLAERWRALLPLIQRQAAGLFTFSQLHWVILRACDSAPCALLIKSCQVPCIYDAAIGIQILCAGFKARLQLLQSKPTQA